MTEFSQKLARDARLKTLQLLDQAERVPLNHSTLQTALYSMSVRLSGDQVRTELSWLSEVGAVRLTEAGSLVIAELTERGRDLARGHASIPGISVPDPGAGI